MIRKAFPTTVGFAGLCSLILLGSPSKAATCGSKEVRDIIENQSAEQINTAKQQLESSTTRDKYGDALLRLYTKGLTFLSSKNYQTGEDGDVKHCKGQLAISLSSGAGININVSYDVISTEDGSILVNQANVANESPPEAGAQMLVSLTDPKNQVLWNNQAKLHYRR